MKQTVLIAAALGLGMLSGCGGEKHDKAAEAPPPVQVVDEGGVTLITVDHADWWFNVRKSNTEPLLRLNVEAPTKEQLDARFAELKKYLGEPAVGH